MNRERVVSLLAALMFIFLGLGVLKLGFIQGREYRQLSDKNCIRLFPQRGARGRILDSQGRVIAGNKLSYNLMILPRGKKHLDEDLTLISQAMGENIKSLQDSFGKGCVSASLPVVVARDISIKQAAALEELKLEVPGIIIHSNPLRSYPYGSLACHTLGYVNEIDHWRLSKLADYGYKTKDIVGFGGVEEKYDYYLRQEEGGLSVEVDHQGRFARVLGFRPPKHGKDIILTLNLDIQRITEDKLDNKKGAVVVMSANSGAIAAMASSPFFDPAVFVDKKVASVAALFNDSAAPLINRAISGLYPPGSVFKAIVAAAGLEKKKIDSSTTTFCNGSILVGKKQFGCWSRHQKRDLTGAIAGSCNVFFYKAGLSLGPNLIHDYAVKFGLGRPALFELPYEAGGVVPSPLWRRVNKFRAWFEGDTANFSIGQGELLTTPLQIACMMAVFANGGYLVTPYIVSSIDGKDAASYHRMPVRVPIKRQTIDEIRKGLREVVRSAGGTAHMFSSLKVSSAGKTGTAQASSGDSHAWFAGFFPYENPEFVICVLLEHGGSGHNAAVVARQIIEAMIKDGLININPKSEILNSK